MPQTVIIDKRFREYRRGVELGIERALKRSASAGAQVAQSKETRVKTGALRGSIGATSVDWGRRGATISILAADFKALWHELGTLAARRRKLKKATLARQATPSGAARRARARGGVKALYFLQAGRRTAAARMTNDLRRELPK